MPSRRDNVVTGAYPPADKWANLAGLLARPGFELHRLVRTSYGPGVSGYLHHNVLGTQRLLVACVQAARPASSPTSATWSGRPCWR